MRVFVLCTGRSGSTTLAQALSHATNMTVGQETRNHLPNGRFDYPDHHIEVDNRLCWFLGPLAERFPDAKWIHLRRDPELVAETFARLWGERSERRSLKWAWRNRQLALSTWRKWRKDPFSTEPRLMILAFAYGILRSPRPYLPEQREEVARLMVDTINTNIQQFLRDRPHWTVSLESFHDDVAKLWDNLGLEGDRSGALAELEVRHNSSRSK